MLAPSLEIESCYLATPLALQLTIYLDESNAHSGSLPLRTHLPRAHLGTFAGHTTGELVPRSLGRGKLSRRSFPLSLASLASLPA